MFNFPGCRSRNARQHTAIVLLPPATAGGCRSCVVVGQRLTSPGSTVPAYLHSSLESRMKHTRTVVTNEAKSQK